MNPRARKRLFASFIILILVCFGLYLYFDNSQSVVTAKTAQLKTETYDVGTPYSGQITKQYVQEGDEVKAGDKLFEIDSTELKLALKKSEVSRSSLGIPLTSDDAIVIEATKPGVVKVINSAQGSFTPANSVLATISQTKDLSVQASVSLTPDQYARISKQSRLVVTLPSGQTVDTSIANINIVNQDNQVVAKLTGDLSRIKYDPLTTKDGTPVQTNLRIQTPLWRRIVDATSSWVKGLLS